VAALGWGFATVLLTLCGVIAYALYQQRAVKVGLLFGAFFFEAKNRKTKADEP